MKHVELFLHLNFALQINLRCIAYLFNIIKHIIQTLNSDWLYSKVLTCRCFLTDAGRPDCSELAAAATHDDGTDAFTVHLHLQSPHSVPEKLQTDLRPALAQRSLSQPLGPRWSLLTVLVTGRDTSRGKYEGRCAALLNQYYSQISLWACTRMSVPALLFCCT